MRKQASLAAAIVMSALVGGDALAGPYSNTKYRVTVSGNQWSTTASGAIGETYNAGDGSYLVCELGSGGLICSAYDARSGGTLSCRVSWATRRFNPQCSSTRLGDCTYSNLTLLTAPSWDYAILNSIAEATAHLSAKQFFTSLTPDSYLELRVANGSTECEILRHIKGGYISPIAQ